MVPCGLTVKAISPVRTNGSTHRDTEEVLDVAEFTLAALEIIDTRLRHIATTDSAPCVSHCIRKRGTKKLKFDESGLAKN